MADGAGYLDKFDAYRRRNKTKGTCPHCGRPCAPFYECEDRRQYKRDIKRKASGQKRGAYQKRDDDMRIVVRGPLRRWTKIEDDTLNQFLLEGVSLEEMITYFRRSELAIITHARKLGSTMFLKRKNRGDGRVYIL